MYFTPKHPIFEHSKREVVLMTCFHGQTEQANGQQHSALQWFHEI